MEQREIYFGICYKLYHFIMKTMAFQAMKTVTLGTPSHHGSSSSKVEITQRDFGAETPCGGNNIEEKNVACRNINIDENVVGELVLPRAPKKFVSINDNVEEITSPGKKRSNSFGDQQEDLKPLRSILKVDCNYNLNDKSNYK
ncbi:hypothetical protein Fmac_007011 [Flemingia macrophylla]|uniref:Uncharacterized protein n=1 Tax=Flemingia macrophylla TaxID=520843 RepID=A0ABD1NC94_9FABA